MALRTLSLCTGAGGLDLAVELVARDVEPLVYIEREVEAAEILAARIEEGSLPPAHVWSDLATFDASQLRGKVDLLLGGLPCQPFSVAGKRQGDTDERCIWPDFIRIVGECRPTVVFLENVPGLISTRTLLHRRDILEHYDRLRDTAGTPKARWYVEYHIERLHRRLLKAHGISALLYVGCQLEAMGYRVEVEEIAASDVGAPHRRERVFILANAIGSSVLQAATGGTGDTRGTSIAGTGGELADAGDGLIPQQGRGPEGRAGPRPAGAAVAHTVSRPPVQGRGAVTREAAGGRAHTGLTGPSDGLANPISPRPQERRRQPRDAGEKCEATERDGAAVEDPANIRGGTSGAPGHGAFVPDGLSGTGIFPPGPGDTEAWSELLVRQPWLRPAISQAEAQSALRDVAPELANLVVQQRTDALRACGNGVVSLQGALALALLLERAQGGR